MKKPNPWSEARPLILLQVYIRAAASYLKHEEEDFHARSEIGQHLKTLRQFQCSMDTASSTIEEITKRLKSRHNPKSNAVSHFLDSFSTSEDARNVILEAAKHVLEMRPLKENALEELERLLPQPPKSVLAAVAESKISRIVATKDDVRAANRERLKTLLNYEQQKQLLEKNSKKMLEYKKENTWQYLLAHTGLGDRGIQNYVGNYQTVVKQEAQALKAFEKSEERYTALLLDADIILASKSRKQDFKNALSLELQMEKDAPLPSNDRAKKAAKQQQQSKQQKSASPTPENSAPQNSAPARSDGPNRDAELITRLKNDPSDAAIYGELFSRHDARLKAYAFSIVKSESVAEDVVQDTWTGFIKGLHDLREPKYFGTWIKRICHNKAITRLRKDGHYCAASDDVFDNAEQIASDNPYEDILKKQRSAIVRSTFERLEDGPAKEAARLYYFEGVEELDDVAQMLGLPRRSIESHLEHFQETMTKRIEGQADRPGSKRNTTNGLMRSRELSSASSVHPA